MSKRYIGKTLLAASIAAFGQLAAPAFAAPQIEEVVVTAQKREQGSNDIGITMNAFSGEQLKEFGVVTPEDMAMHTPGLTVNQTSATGVPLYTIRGVGFQDYSTAASSTVGLYFDEISMPYTVMTRGAVFDVARVEVLKGPQGDLYGRNTTAGQINFVSNMPTEEFEAGIRASYGRFKTLDAEGYLSGPLGDGVQGRLAYKTVQSGEGWQHSLTRNDELGEQDVNAIRGLLKFDLGESADLLLNVHYVKDKSDNTATTAYDGTSAGLGEFALPYAQLADYILPTGAHFGETPPWYSTNDNQAADWTNSYTSPLGRTYDLRPQRDNELKGFSAKLNWEINGMTLTSITGYDKFEREEANDWDGGFYNDSSNINTTDLDVFSQELRLSGETGDVVWIVGAYYSKDEMDEFYNYFMSDSLFGNGSVAWGGIPPFAATPIMQLHTRYDQETESAAGFGHIEWSFADKWRLTLGARYTHEKRDWSGCTFSAEDGTLATFLNANFGTTLGPGDCGTVDDDPNSPTYVFALLGTPNANDAFHVYDDSIKTNKWMGKIGIDYQLTDDALLYATLSRGFKSGGFNGANSNTTLQLKPYNPEQLTSFEVGAKSTLLEGSMQLNVSAFYYDYKDKQEQDASVTFVGNISGLTNVPKSEIWGAEADMQWLPVEGLSVNMGLAWLDTEVKKWNAVDQANSAWPNTVYYDASGIELAQSPEWQFNSTVAYEWAVSDALVMQISGDVSYKDETSGGASPEDATEDYWLLGARVSVGSADEKWRATLWGRNLSDEVYYPAAFQGGNGPWVRAMGMPRTYGVTLEYKM